MRSVLLAGIAAVAIGAGVYAAPPQRIVFARVFPNDGQIGLFVAARDGSGEHPLLATHDMDYDPVWSPDGASIVFTSDREGSADLFRVTPSGGALERLTDSPAYDDQAAFSPDSKQLAFVSTRNGGRSNIWILDLATRQARPLTSDTGGNYRPSWSPDGQWIAFSSSRGTTLTFAHGRWEHLQFADIYVSHPDGTGLKRLATTVTSVAVRSGPPTAAASSRIAWTCRRRSRRGARRHNQAMTHRLVSIDLATGTSTEITSGPGVKFNPSMIGANEVGYIRKDTDDAGIYYTGGGRGPKGPVRAASWSPDGSRVVFHRRQTAPTVWWKSTWSRDAEFELALTSAMPSFGRDPDSFVVVARPPAGGILGSGVAIATPGSNASKIVYQDPKRNVLGPSVGAGWEADHFLGRRVQCVLQRLQQPVPEGERSRRGWCADRGHQSRRHRVPRTHHRPEQQRLPVHGAGWQAFRLSKFWTGWRGAEGHEHRDRRGLDADQGIRRFSIVVAARRSDHVLAARRRRLRHLHDQA